MVARKHAVKKQASNRSLKNLILKLRVLWGVCSKHLYFGAKIDKAVIVGVDGVVRRSKEFALTLGAVNNFGHPISAERHVEQFFRHHRFRRSGLQNIFVGRNNVFGFELGFFRKRHVHGHLVAVEVSVKSATNKRVDLYGVAFNQHRTEGLNTLAVKRRRAVKKHVLAANDVLKYRPNFRHPVFNEASGAANVIRKLLLQ